MLNDLNTCFLGGYSRIDTLRYIQQLAGEIEMLEVAAENMKKGLEYTVPHHTEEKNIRGALFGGYNRDDVDNFVGELFKKITELRHIFQ